MRHVVLLRGINVGKGNRVPMAGFRALLEALGHSGVLTLLNSGNAVFTAGTKASGPALATAIAKGLDERMGVSVPVVVKSRAQWKAIVEANPWASRVEDPSRLLVAFAPDREGLDALAAVGDLAGRDEWHLGDHAAYLHCPAGILESAAASALLGKAGRGVTTRNWATVSRISAAL